MNKLATVAVVALMLVHVAVADMYMHVPPGSNDRNRERNDNRNNDNRLFDSQNNARGGYPWRGDPTVQNAPDPVTYYVGSILRIEWTNQHACGPNDNLYCQVVVQYGCEAEKGDEAEGFVGLRDGYPNGALQAADNNNAQYQQRAFTGEGGQNADGTNAIDDNKFANDLAKKVEFFDEGLSGGGEFGYHESIWWYDRCKNTQRNKGLYIADRQLNGNAARFTRQNNNGGRSGLECPEERDYYPYWRPVPWRDVAILVSSTSHCDFLQENSQNVKAYGWCDCDATCRQGRPASDNLTPITKELCEAANTANIKGTWNEGKKLGGGKPICRLHAFGRDNHLGNTAPTSSDGGITAEKFQPETAHFNWQIPSFAANKLCTVRLRYNISTMDYPSMSRKELPDAKLNCPTDGQRSESVEAGTPTQNEIDTLRLQNKPHCTGLLEKDTVPLFNRPYVKLFGVEDSSPALGIALNTNQAGRTFQDRSYVFRVAKAPSYASGGTIYNLGLRGKRGNIVQAYPAVEYDFAPSELEVSQGDWIHIQFHGSNYNAAKNNNNGEGWQYSDRTNMVEVDKAGSNFPSYRSRMNLFNSEKLAKRFALLDQTDCGVYFNNANNEQNAYNNCGKLNRAPSRFPNNPKDGLVAVNQDNGVYHYVSTRNNNFSNRSQKGTIRVSGGGLTMAEKAAIGVGVTLGVGLAVFGVLAYGKKKPDTCCGRCYTKLASSCGKSKGSKLAASPPDMEYSKY